MIKKIFLITFFSCALSVFCISVYNSWLSYTPIPYWDLWGTPFNFFTQFHDGNYSSLWAQHNEHRPIIYKILALIDLKIFGGLGKLTYILTYLVYCFTIMVLYKMLGYSSPNDQKIFKICLLIFMFTFGFFWCQSLNFTFISQTALLLSELIPLLALFCYAKSLDFPDNKLFFIFACILSISSIGTIANGLLAPFLLLAFPIFTKEKINRTIIVGICTIFSVTVYLYHYTPTELSSHMSETAVKNPIAFLHYIALYMGAPFFYLFDQTSTAKIFAVELGILFIISIATITVLLLKNKRQNPPIIVAILMFCGYNFSSAVLAASGRLSLGVDQALAPRYTTYSIMAWISLIIVLYLIEIQNKSKIIKYFFAFILFTTSILILNKQIDYIVKVEDINPELINRETSLLAIILNLNDQKLIESTSYPVSKHVIDIANRVKKISGSIFGVYPYKDLEKELGKKFIKTNQQLCSGNLDMAKFINKSNGFFKVKGWLYDNNNKKVPKLIRFVNKEGIVIGIALSGQLRQDVSEAIDKEALMSGFNGYIISDKISEEITIYGERPSCYLKARTVPHRITNITSNNFVSDTSQCNGSIDDIEKKGDSLTIQGWLNSDEKGSTHKPPIILLYNKINNNYISIYPKNGIYRPDVGKAFGSDKLNYSGFHLSLDIESLSDYNKAVLAFKQDNNIKKCHNITKEVN